MDIINLNESFADTYAEYFRFKYAIEGILKGLFGGYSVPVSIKGTQDQVREFAKVLAGEKKYFDAYRSFGLNNPATYKSKFELNKAIREFERKTKISYPFK